MREGLITIKEKGNNNQAYILNVLDIFSSMVSEKLKESIK